MVSTTSKAYNLTVHNTASPPYSLKAMTVVVLIFMPLVLAYQTWTYYVFRRRVSSSEFQPRQRVAPPRRRRPQPARNYQPCGRLRGTLQHRRAADDEPCSDAGTSHPAYPRR